MATTPPDKIPTWATDGGAAVTDPGTAKQADGWLVDEAPSANNTNWLQNRQGDWLQFFRDKIGPQVATNNMDYRPETGPVGVGSHKITYLEKAARWYNSGDVGGGVVEIRDSIDGITWSLPFTISLSGFNGTLVFEDDSGSVFVGIGTVIYESTSGAVADFVDTGANFASMDTAVSQIVWNPVFNVFTAVGLDSGGASIETAPAIGGPWTNRDLRVSVTNHAIAVDPVTGVSCVTQSTSTEVMYQTVPTNSPWLYTTGLSQAGGTQLYWSDVLERFIWISLGLTDYVGVMDTAGNVAEPADLATLETNSGLANTPEGVLLFAYDDTEKFGSMTLLNTSNPTNLAIVSGPVLSRYSGNSGSDMFNTQQAQYGKGAYKWVWWYDSQDHAMIAEY